MPKLKTQKKETKDESVRIRCHKEEKQRLQLKANLYTNGNLSEYLLYAGLNYIPVKEELENEDQEFR